ncbi:MAG: endonuclease Q family protein [Candidatus Firestonebacteria bacterium]
MLIADLHIHSKYSMATSRDMDIDHLTKSAKIKGVNLLATGDFTHPFWLNELKNKLKPLNNGLFENDGILYILSAEISNIFHRAGKLKKIHTELFAPSFEAVDKINKVLAKYGNLTADGRPTLTFDIKELVKAVLNVCPECIFVPAHAWTPWFSVFGSNSGFDSIEECFQEQSKHIFAIETGLSSDPAMNWRISKLDTIGLISNSDAHSPAKIGREANVFDIVPSFTELMNTIKKKDKTKFLYTIEFYPEEGKYHYDGHRNCKVCMAPQESIKVNNKCPVCGKLLTIGVVHRVEKLADRKEGEKPANFIPYKNLVSLGGIISEAIGKAPGTIAVANEYNKIINAGENELNILINLSEDNLYKIATPKIAEGIIRVRNGKIKIYPGHDGEYGKITIFTDDEVKDKVKEEKPKKQMSLF